MVDTVEFFQDADVFYAIPTVPTEEYAKKYVATFDRLLQGIVNRLPGESQFMKLNPVFLIGSAEKIKDILLGLCNGDPTYFRFLHPYPETVDVVLRLATNPQLKSGLENFAAGLNGSGNSGTVISPDFANSAYLMVFVTDRMPPDEERLAANIATMFSILSMQWRDFHGLLDISEENDIQKILFAEAVRLGFEKEAKLFTPSNSESG